MTFAIGSGMFALFPYMTFYLQNDLGNTALQGGLKMLPETLPCFAVPLITRKLSEKLAPQISLGSGMALISIGLVTMAGLTAGSSWTHLLAGMVITGTGIGLCNPAIAKIALGTVHPARSGMASGISNTMRIGGLSVGIAGLGALFQSRLTSGLSSLGGHPGGLTAQIAASGPRSVNYSAMGISNSAGLHGAMSAYASAMNYIFTFGAILTGAGAVVAFVFIRASDYFSFGGPQPGGPPGQPASGVGGTGAAPADGPT